MATRRCSIMKKYLLLSLILLSFIFAQNIKAQNYIQLKNAPEQLKKDFQNGKEYFDKKDYDKSVKLFSKILIKEPRFIDARIFLAASFDRQKKYDNAIAEYKNVLKTDTLYEPEVLLAIGRLLKTKEQYKDAAYYYARFIALTPATDNKRQMAADEAGVCRFLANAMADKKDIHLYNLGPTINTSAHEYLPCLSVDGKTLIFTRVVNNNEDFYQSIMNDDGSWSSAEPIHELNTPMNEAGQTISADGRTLVFVACDYPDSYGSCDLYISYLKNGVWTPAKNMGNIVNSTSWDSQPSLSADGKVLFFTSSRRGGMGGSDIWVTFKDANGNWKKPGPLAAPINDAGKSESPFIHPDGRTLYFRSDRKPGIGGFDLYMAKMDEAGKWSVPLNLGYPINTSEDEGALIVSTDGTTAYYSSDVKNSADIPNYGKNDIYRFTLPTEFRPGKVTYLKAKVIDDASGKAISANVQLQRLKTGTSLTDMMVEDDGIFLVCIPAGEAYALNVSKPGYTFYSANFTMDTVTRTEPFDMTISLQKITGNNVPGNKPVVLNNIFFNTGSASLRQESEYELNKLLAMLVENPSIKIQINGHTDDVGNEADNLKLSTDRAKAVYDFLKAKGIDAARLSYKGFGEKMPLVENKDEKSRQTNRRTEFEIK